MFNTTLLLNKNNIVVTINTVSMGAVGLKEQEGLLDIIEIHMAIYYNHIIIIFLQLLQM